MSSEDLTLDRFLGGRVIAAQPAKGFRAGHDTVLLAAAVPAGAGSVALELGSGAGVASLCLAARVPGARIVGIEIDPELVRLANENAARNGVADRVFFFTADTSAFLPMASNLDLSWPAKAGHPGDGGFRPGVGTFDHVFFNPPFHPYSAHASPVGARDRATRDSSDAIRSWTGRALSLVRDGGTVTAIVRADRVHEILDEARDSGGIVFPLFPRSGANPKRVIIRIIKTERVSADAKFPIVLPSPLEGSRADERQRSWRRPERAHRAAKQRARGRKGGDAQANAGFATAAGLILHEADGRPTQAAEAVLRHAQALSFT